MAQRNRVCPDCRGRNPRRCGTCTPSAALGDQARSALRRAANTVTGRSAEAGPDGVRSTRLGSESVGLTPARKRKLPANAARKPKKR